MSLSHDSGFREFFSSMHMRLFVQTGGSLWCCRQVFYLLTITDSAQLWNIPACLSAFAHACALFLVSQQVFDPSRTSAQLSRSIYQHAGLRITTMLVSSDFHCFHRDFVLRESDHLKKIEKNRTKQQLTN